MGQGAWLLFCAGAIWAGGAFWSADGQTRASGGAITVGDRKAPTNVITKATQPAQPVKPAFTRKQVVQRLNMLKRLRDRGLILQPFYERKVRECETGLSE